jgi:H+/gluconate symporter-like permease
LHHLPLALALVVVLVGVLPWIRPLGLRAILGKVISTSAVIAPIVAIPTIELWGIWPWAKLLLLL